MVGQVEMQYDWSAVSSIVRPYMPEGLELQGQRTDNINFESQYPVDEPNQLLANLTANAGVGFEQAGGRYEVSVPVGALGVRPSQRQVPHQYGEVAVAHEVTQVHEVHTVT